MLAFPVPLAPQVSANSNGNAGSTRQATLVIPRVYLSDYSTASNRDQVLKLGITHVVSVLELDPDIPESIPEENKLHISIADRPDVDILAHLERTTEFIKGALEADVKNKVLVHCILGVSRSATVVCAYLIATSNMGGSDSIAFVQSKRSVVCPNLGFRQQLDAYSLRFSHNRWKRPASLRSFKSVSEGVMQRVKKFRVVKES